MDRAARGTTSPAMGERGPRGCCVPTRRPEAGHNPAAAENFSRRELPALVLPALAGLSMNDLSRPHVNTSTFRSSPGASTALVADGKGIFLHSLRHTHGSQLLSQGVPLPAVSKRLGHANRAITAAIYSHALSEDEAAAAVTWNKAMEQTILGTPAAAEKVRPSILMVADGCGKGCFLRIS